MKKLNTFAKLSIASSMAFGAVAPTVMMMAPVHAEEVMEGRDVRTLVVELDGSLVYNGTAQTQKVKVKDGETVLEENVDYTLEGNTATEVGNYIMTVKGMNSFSGERSIEYSVSQADVVNLFVQNEEPEREIRDISKFNIELANQLTENGEYQTQKVSITDGSWVLEEGVDYTLENNVARDAGTYKMTVNGINDFKGSVDVTYTVKAQEKEIRNISKFNIALVNQLTENGEYQTQKVSITDGSLILEEGIDYTLENNVARDAGTYKMTVNGINDFKGSVDVTYTVKAKAAEKTDISKCNIVLTNVLTENGTYQTQKVKITTGKWILEEGIDYTLSNNVAKDAGTYAMTITAKGDVVQGSVKVNYTVAASKDTKKNVHTATASNAGLFAALGAGALAALAGVAVVFSRKRK